MIMGSANKYFNLEFDGMEQLVKRLDNVGISTKEAAESALKASYGYVTANVKQAMKPYKRTGQTEDAIIGEPKVEWSGNRASINIGFDIGNGGLASIFLMYGTKVFGQPHVKPDKTLYNSIYGTQTKKHVRELQQEVFLKKIERALK